MTSKTKKLTKAVRSRGLSVTVGSASLTRVDRDALKRLPDGEWFGLRKVSYMVKNARWRCDRLAEKGTLESRVVGEWPSSETQWRKLPNNSGQTAAKNAAK